MHKSCNGPVEAIRPGKMRVQRGFAIPGALYAGLALEKTVKKNEHAFMQLTD